MTVAPEDSNPQRPAPNRAVRGAFLLTLALLALTLVVAARSRPVVEDSRIGDRVELVELIREEQARVSALSAKVEELSAQIAAHERRPSGQPDIVAALNEQIDAIAPHAGLRAVRGPGLEVTMTDSSLQQSPSGDLNDLVIHEQDLQAIINGLWAGGAEAMTVNGQRVLSTTAIRCVGNTLLLHGSVYSPPYRIAAVGDAEAIRGTLERDQAVQRFRRAAEEFELGFTVSDAPELVLPAYEGSLGLGVARPAGTSSS